MNEPCCFRTTRFVARHRRLIIPIICAVILRSGVSQGQSVPQPVPLPPTLEKAIDKPYPGTIRLHVDATDVLRRIFTVEERIPVGHDGPFTLLFPQWVPGDHAPNQPLEKLAGLVISAHGLRLNWVRDTVDVHAFHVNVPRNTTELQVNYQYLGSTDPITGPVLITPTMLDLQWQSLVLYPTGYFARDLPFAASLTVPWGWTTLTSLDNGRISGNTTSFPTLTLEALVDQPVMAGRYLKQIALGDRTAPIRLDVAAQSLDDLAGLPELAKHLAPLIEQTNKEFGSHHYDHYDLMLFLSDEIRTYYEHHRSGENTASPHLLSSATEVPQIPYVEHGYIHSWNGEYRRPAEMWTPNLNSPEQDSMLWVFEGLTDYLENVLCARAGLFTPDDIQRNYAGLAASMTLDVGANWRSLQDTNNDPLISGRQALSWTSWQRNMFDTYNVGEMIWLEVDAIIRQESGGKRSIDDFACTFFSGNDEGNVTAIYTFDDLVAALDLVQTYDWRTFLRSRLDDYGSGRLVHSIDRTGYRLVFTDKPIGDAPLGKSLGLTYSLGMRIDAAGKITTVQWQGPAFQANLIPGETIIEVNGQHYAPELLVQAITAASSGGKINLLVKHGDWQQMTSIDWHGGMRFPHLQRIEGTTDLLDAILAPRS